MYHLSHVVELDVTGVLLSDVFALKIWLRGPNIGGGGTIVGNHV
jgi:hypothetical protein